MPRLISVQFNASSPPLDGLGTITRIKIREPEDRFRGFQVCARGPIVYLVSPPGWNREIQFVTYDAKGPRRIWEIPRSQVNMQFEGATLSDVDKLQVFDSEIAMRPVAEPTEEELDAATAPKAAARR